MIEPEVRWIVGDGKKIKVREDKWLPIGKIGGPTNQNDPHFVEELINQDTKEWKVHKLTELFDENVVQEILSAPLSHNPTIDKLGWTRNSAGSYWVKSGYNKICSQDKKSNANQPSSSYQPPRTLWTKIWQTHSYPEV